MTLPKKADNVASPKELATQFPVSVDPKNKTITENTQIDTYLNSEAVRLSASANDSGNIFVNIFNDLALTVADSSWYQSLAAVGSSKPVTKYIVLNPGLRKEQVANIFVTKLGWNSKQRKAFLATSVGFKTSSNEGHFSPGIYFVDSNSSTTAVQNIINDRFDTEILSHYGTSTASIVPLDQALKIASLIQRETIGTKDMRLVSGIIWNRIFKDMNLQLDSTLQYAKASAQPTSVWWPTIRPNDKYIKSPYNTYLNSGLPPTPIASPSVAAVLAALNPIKTDCLFYFSDQSGNMHCSKTYAEHLDQLSIYYH